MLPGMMNTPRVTPWLATDFGDHATGAVTSQGWTFLGTSTNIDVSVSAIADSLSGQRMGVEKTVSDAVRQIKWDRVGQRADIEILACIKLKEDPANTSGTTGQVNVRMAAATAGDPYYVALPRKISSVKKFEIGRGDGAGGGVALGNVNKAWDITNWWWIRFRVIGNSQKGRMWQDGTAEPATWELDFTNANVPGAGYAGFATFYTDASYVVSWYAVAIDGATAPGPSG